MMWFASDIERVAQALILSNSDPQFRAGVAALAHALGAVNVRIRQGAPTIAQIANGQQVTR